jgi:tripartite-type tricarboxylate transporter receptor subunit TctC
VKEQLAKFSATVVASTPEELGEHVKRELAKWAPIVKASGARID